MSVIKSGTEKIPSATNHGSEYFANELLHFVAAQNEGIISSEHLKAMAILFGAKALTDRVVSLNNEGRAEVDFNEEFQISQVRLLSDIGRTALKVVPAPETEAEADHTDSSSSLPTDVDHASRNETITELILRGVSARTAIVNYLSSLPGKSLENGDERSAGSRLAKVLAKYGHTPGAVSQALKSLVKDGSIEQTKPYPSAKVLTRIELGEDVKKRLVPRQATDKLHAYDKLSEPTKRKFKHPDNSPDFFYEDSSGYRLYVDLSASEFKNLPPEDRFLVVAARFHTVKFIGVSVYDSILQVVKLKKGEDADDILHQELVDIDEHTVHLTKAGEERLRTLTHTIAINEEISEAYLNPTNFMAGHDIDQYDSATEIQEQNDPNEQSKNNIFLQAFKQHLRKMGYGITINPGNSVTSQFKDICINELGYSKDDTNRLYLAVRNDHDILKVSFKRGSKVEPRYLGLVEFQDDPLTQAQIMTNNLRHMLGEYVSIVQKLRLRFDPNVLAHRKLCEQMTQTEWTDYPYENLEQYMHDVLQALRSTAQRIRILSRQ